MWFSCHSVEGELISRELGLILRPQGDLLRLVDSYTGQMLATSKEYARRVESETQRADLAEAKIIELQKELERLHQKKN
jgi:hypothetical protein